MKPLHDLAAKWDATAARNQRNGQSLIDQGDEYGSEGLAIAEALGACVVDLRAVLADYETDTDAQPAPDFRALIRDNLIPEPAPELAAAMANAEVAYEQWIGQRNPADVGSMAGFTAGWQFAVAAASGWPKCPNGCGCRLGTEDADQRDCACDGLCCHDEIEVSELFAERDKLRKRFAYVAAALDSDALATQPSKKSQIQADAARRIREALT